MSFKFSLTFSRNVSFVPLLYDLCRDMKTHHAAEMETLEEQYKKELRSERATAQEKLGTLPGLVITHYMMQVYVMVPPPLPVLPVVHRKKTLLVGGCHCEWRSGREERSDGKTFNWIFS